MRTTTTGKPVLRWNKKAIIIIDSRLAFVPLEVSITKAGKLLTTTQVANLLQVPPDRVIRWIDQGKVLSPVQLSILERQERPEGFIKRDGSARVTDKQKFHQEQANVASEHIQAGRVPSYDDIYKEAVARCLQKYNRWTPKYIAEITFNIREENPSIRKKTPRSKVRIRAQAQRRAHLYK
jgi:hypothetical protein